MLFLLALSGAIEKNAWAPGVIAEFFALGAVPSLLNMLSGAAVAGVAGIGGFAISLRLWLQEHLSNQTKNVGQQTFLAATRSPGKVSKQCRLSQLEEARAGAYTYM